MERERGGHRRFVALAIERDCIRRISGVRRRSEEDLMLLRARCSAMSCARVGAENETGFACVSFVPPWLPVRASFCRLGASSFRSIASFPLIYRGNCVSCLGTLFMAGERS